MISNYYQKHKEKLRKEVQYKKSKLSEKEKGKRWKQVWERYQNPVEEEQENNRQYHREHNKNLSKEQK